MNANRKWRGHLDARHLGIWGRAASSTPSVHAVRGVSAGGRCNTGARRAIECAPSAQIQEGCLPMPIGVGCSLPVLMHATQRRLKT